RGGARRSVGLDRGSAGNGGQSQPDFDLDERGAASPELISAKCRRGRRKAQEISTDLPAPARRRLTSPRRTDIAGGWIRTRRRPEIETRDRGLRDEILEQRIDDLV